MYDKYLENSNINDGNRPFKPWHRPALLVEKRKFTAEFRSSVSISTHHPSLPQDFGRTQHRHDPHQTEAMVKDNKTKFSFCIISDDMIRRTCRVCSSVISSDAFIPFRVISLANRVRLSYRIGIRVIVVAYQLTIRLRPSQSLLPLNRA